MAQRPHVPLSVATVADLPAEPVLRQPRRWSVENAVTVEVDGTKVWDHEEERALPAVVLQMPAYVARHLACILDDWSTICRILESARPFDERDLAGALHEAAHAADALRSPAEDSPVTGADRLRSAPG
jgi:hypothetical protein